MSITVSGRRMNVSDSLRTYAEEKIENATKVLDADPIAVEVVLSKEKNPANPLSSVCEVTVHVKGHIVRVEEEDEDMFAAIDVAAAKTARQLRKYKTRIVDKRIRASERMVEQVRDEARVEGELDLDRLMEELSDDEVVRVKEIEFAPMTEAEALVEIDLIGHDFFVYTDRDSNLVCVLYRRDGGGYGKLQQKEA